MVEIRWRLDDRFTNQDALPLIRKLSFYVVKAHDSFAIAFSIISDASSAAVFGNSGMTHFTLPARISSWAMRQGLRECVSITGGAPPCNWRARRAATRMYR